MASDSGDNTDGLFVLGYLQVPDFAPFIIQQSNPSTYDPYLILPTTTSLATNVIAPTVAPLDRREMVGLLPLASKPLWMRHHMQNHNRLVAEFNHEVKCGNPSAIKIQKDRRALYHEWISKRRLALGLPEESQLNDGDFELLQDSKPFEPRIESTVSAWTGLFMACDDDDDDSTMSKLERASKVVQQEKMETKAVAPHRSWMLEDELKEIEMVQQRLANRTRYESEKLGQIQDRAKRIQAHCQAKCVTHDGWPCDVNTIWDWNGNYKDAGMYSHPVILGFKFARQG